jgi:DNA-binding MarR family transcriptional regulator
MLAFVVFASPCHCTRLRRAAQRVTQLYDAALDGTGLKITQFSLLRAIEREGEPALGRLSKATGLDRSTLGRDARVLRRAGLVALGHGTDGRTTVVSLTEAGRERLRAALPHWERTQRRLDEALGPDGRSRLEEILGRVAALDV